MRLVDYYSDARFQGTELIATVTRDHPKFIMLLEAQQIGVDDAFIVKQSEKDLFIEKLSEQLIAQHKA